MLERHRRRSAVIGSVQDGPALPFRLVPTALRNLRMLQPRDDVRLHGFRLHRLKVLWLLLVLLLLLLVLLLLVLRLLSLILVVRLGRRLLLVLEQVRILFAVQDEQPRHPRGSGRQEDGHGHVDRRRL